MLAPAARKVPPAARLTTAPALVRDPGLALIAFLVVLSLAGVLAPLFVTIWSSFRDGLLIESGPLVLSNYTSILRDPAFPGVLANTLLLGVGTVAVLIVFTVPM